MIANDWSRPSPASTIPESPGTTVGASRVAVEPSPSAPRYPRPQVATVPSARTPMECWAPASTCAYPADAIRTGDRASTVEPLPTWPYWLSPQAHTPPDASRASAWLRPADSSTMPERPGTGTGDVRRVVVPSPISPFTLLPQARTVPVAVSA